MNYKAKIAVFGGRTVGKELYAETVEIGRLMAEENWLVFCGGGSGVMEAVSRGVKEGGGTCVGILKGVNRDEANDHLTLSVPTGVGIGRNVILAYSCDVAIAISGRYGTLSEIAHALSLDKKVIGYKTWDIENVDLADSPDEVLQKINSVLPK